MYPEALAYLRCPRHTDVALTLHATPRTAADGAIVYGHLGCAACQVPYPIRNGILDLLGSGVLPDSPAQLTNVLPIAAWGYERTWRPQALTLLSGEAFGYDRELPLITRLAAPERGGLIVDVACSNGLYARALEQARGSVSGHVIGIDHALPMLEQARAYAHSAGLRISFVRAKAQALPFGAETASVLTMGGSLNEIGDAPQALRELRRSVTSDGRIVLMSLVRGQQRSGQALQRLLGLGGLAFPSLAELNHLVARADLRLCGQWQYGVVVFSLLA